MMISLRRSHAAWMAACACLAFSQYAPAAGDTGPVRTAASWIWFPEDVATEGSGQARYFRRVVRLKTRPVFARLRVRADDGYAFWVNGKPAPQPEKVSRAGTVYDLKRVLKPGKNVLAFRVFNAVGKGGLIVTGRVREADGSEQVICSDSTFRASRESPEGWTAPGFDDSRWPRARIVGSAFAAPWFRHPAFDMTPFIGPDDWRRWRALRDRLLKSPPGLDREKPTRARFAFVNGQCALVVNGKPRPPLFYRGTVDPLSQHGRRQIALFRDAGVHVYAAYAPLALCWLDDGSYDFARLDDLVRGYLSVDPQALLFLIFRLIPPNSWMDKHPDELVRYAAGPDYNTSNECGRVRRPSLASELWRRDALAIWRAAIEHLEAKPWGKRVIAYQPGYGIYTEWHYFGSWTNQMPDTGPAMTRRFRAWLRKHYGSVERLRAAWGRTDVTFETAQVPGVAPRLLAGPLGLRRLPRGRWVMDYYRCQQEVTAEDIELFCAAAKKATAGRALCGAFYGYFYGVPPQTQGGHLELERLLRSPSIDYFAAPYDYSHRLMGDDGRARSIVDAFALAGKVHLIEADTRTYLHPRDEHGRLRNAAESLAAIRREVATALTHGCALWWCDFGADGSGGWYDDPALIGEVRKMMRLAEQRLTRRVEPVARVALVCDLKSCYWLGDGEAMRAHLRLVDQVTSALYRTGTPFDTILLSQLAAGFRKETPPARFSRYRLLIFLNALCVTPAERAGVRAATRGRSVLWLWTPGVADGERFGPELVRDLTGFRVALRGTGASVSQVVCVAQHPLTRGIPAVDEFRLAVRKRAVVSAFLDPRSWFNPRSDKVMRAYYTRFDWRREGDALCWRFCTTKPWTDIHLNAVMERCDGLRLRVAGVGAAAGAPLRVAVKSADGGEFASPGFALSPRPREIVLPMASFTRAPWSRRGGEAIVFPLRGLKLVLDGVTRNRPGQLTVQSIEMAWGATTRRRTRRFGDPSYPLTVLTIEDPAAAALGRDADSGAVVLACKGAAGARRVFAAYPYVPRPLLSALIRDAGARPYVDSPDVIVRADSDLIALHTKRGGKHALRLPRPARLSHALSSEALGRGAALKLTLPPCSTTLLTAAPLPR